MHKKIISIHIPKTAGTTFQLYLNSIYHNDMKIITTKPLFRRCDSNFTSAEQLNIDQYQEYVIHGHFRFDELKYNQDYFYITWLRDPVERVISHYYFWKNRPDIDMHPIEKRIKKENLSLVEFAKIPCMKNISLYFLGSQSSKYFNFIGITELFEESMTLLSKKLDKDTSFNIENQRINRNKDSVTSEVKDIIRELNWEENEFYNFIVSDIKSKNLKVQTL